MKQGKLNLEYIEQESTVLFKCQKTGTEYHHVSLDFEFVRAEIDKKNSTSVVGNIADDQVFTYEYCRSIGFCEYGIKDFCKKLGIDIDGSFTKKELIKACKENEEVLFILTIYYSDEIKNLLGDIKFSDEVIDKLKDDPDWYTRTFVASYGYALEYLKDDPIYDVRLEVVKHGYYLEQFKDDEDYNVRCAVVRRGYALEQLKDDPDYIVRAAVAEKGYALEELKDDEDCNVRAEVAKQGYALEQLKSDDHWGVRSEVAKKGYSLNELKGDTGWCVRREVARQGYALDELEGDDDWSVRYAATKSKMEARIKRQDSNNNK